MIETQVSMVPYFIVLVIGAILYSKASGGLLKPSLPMLFFWCYLIFSYIGMAYYASAFVARGYGHPDARILWKVWTDLSLCFLIVPIIIIVLNRIVDVRSEVDEAQCFEEGPSYSLVVLIPLIVVATIPTLMFMRKLESVPLFLALSGASYADMGVARSDSTNAFGGNYHWYSLFFAHIIPFLSYVVLFNYIKARKHLILFIILFILSITGSLLTLQKAPVLFYLMSIAFAYYYFQMKLVPFRKMVIFGLLIVFLLFAVTGLSGVRVVERGGDMFVSLMNRTFCGQILPLYFYYDMFPKYQDYLLGSSFPNPGGFLPFNPVSVTKMVSYMIAEGKGEVVGSAPTVFFGEVYANFGTVGAVMSMMFVGVIIHFVHRFSYLFRKNIVSMAFFIWFIFDLSALSMTGISRYFFNTYMFGVLVFALILYYGSKMLRVATRRD